MSSSMDLPNLAESGVAPAQSLGHPVRTLWNWVLSHVHLIRQTYHVRDGMERHRRVSCALDLGHPDWVQASSTHTGDEASIETYPRATIVKYHFPKRSKKLPELELTWYDGHIKPQIPALLPSAR